MSTARADVCGVGSLDGGQRVSGRQLLAVLAAALLLSLLLSALAAWLLPAATPWFRSVLPVPGLVLPSAHRLGSAAQAALPTETARPGLACASAVFFGTTYTLIDPAGLTVAQMDMHNFPFGVTSARLTLERTERSRDGTPLRRYRYVNEHLGLCTGAFMLWFDGAGELHTRPGVMFWLLWPWAALFAVASALALGIVDGTRWAALRAGLMFWPALLLSGAAAGAAAGSSALLWAGLPWLATALALRAWHSPRWRAVPLVAIFVVACLLLHVLINLLLGLWLVATGAWQLPPQIDAQLRLREGTVASTMYELDQVPTPWAAALPTWAEVCPPFRRSVLPMPAP